MNNLYQNYSLNSALGVNIEALRLLITISTFCDSDCMI